MKIIIERQLTRAERMLLLLQAIEETEQFGYGEVNVQIHNHQIVDISRNERKRFGNCDPEWYKVLHDS